MPRAKRVEKKTRTIKVYESNALLIDQILKRKPAGTTYAQVVEEIFHFLYPKGLNAVERASENIGAALEADDQERGTQIPPVST